MREDLLFYLWKTQKFRRSQLQTTSVMALVVVKPGQENQYSGPDFFNAHIQIDNTLWLGNVELHVRSSDWFRHKHQTNEKYDNVVLHVVWDDDVPVFDSSQQLMPTLRLAQLAWLFNHKSDLLAQILKAKNIENFYNILDAKTSPFWERHYHF